MSTSTLLEPETLVAAAEDLRGRIVETIRTLHGRNGGLSRIHRSHAALYAQARRAFGSWRDAVAAAGLDYEHERDQSLRRGLSLRDQRRAVWHALSRFLVDLPSADDAALDSLRPELAKRVRRCWGDLQAAKAWAERKS